MIKCFKYSAIIIFTLILFGCKQTKSLKVQSLNKNELEALIIQEKKALEASSRNDYLHYANLALLHHKDSNSTEAAKYYEKAWKWFDEHLTQNIVNLGVSKLYNDTVKTYRPHYLVRYQFRFMAILNYLTLNDSEKALIETRRLSRLIRMDKDYFSEKRSVKARQYFLIITSILFSHNNEINLGWADMLYAYRLNKETFPEKFLPLINLKNEGDNSKFISYVEKNKAIKITCKGLFLGLKSVSTSVNVNDYWSHINVIQGDSEDELLKDALTSLLARKVVKITYAVPHFYANDNENFLYSFNELFSESWELQKTRLVTSALFRIVYKSILAYGVSNKLSKGEEDVFGVLLGNIGSYVIWATEKADTRTISYLPNFVKIDLFSINKNENQISTSWE